MYSIFWTPTKYINNKNLATFLIINKKEESNPKTYFIHIINITNYIKDMMHLIKQNPRPFSLKSQILKLSYRFLA